VHPGGIQTELGRYMTPEVMQQLITSIDTASQSAGAPAVSWKTIPQGAATSVWAAVVASAGESIDSVAISYSVGFTDLRQVRISGVTAPTVPDSGATLSLLGASLIGLAFLRRKLAA